MDEMIRMSVPADDDGFVEFQCPNCSQRFKYAASDFQEMEGPDMWCPLCGLFAEPSEFFTPEVRNAAVQHVENLVADMLNDFSKGLERSMRGSKAVTFKAGRPIPHEEVDELRTLPHFELVQFECCAAEVKVDAAAAHAALYCPRCGEVRA